MASEDTRLGNEFKFQVSVGGSSPETFHDFCAVVDTGGIGEEKPLVDVTSLCDDARTYRGGLADGKEIPLKCNFIQGDATIRHLYELYQSNSVSKFRMSLDDTSPAEYFEFSAIIRAWELATPVGDKASVTFTLKISGVVDWVYA